MKKLKAIKKFKKSLLITLFGSMGLVSSNAQAFPVNDATLILTTEIMSQMISSAFATQLSTMNANHVQLMMYLTGQTNGGNGLVEGVTSINEKLGFLVQSTKQGAANNEVAERSRMEEMLQIMDKKGTLQDADACSEATFAAMRGSANSGTRDMNKVVNSYDANAVKHAPTTDSQMGEVLVSREKKGYCSATEAANGVGFCKGGAAGPLENADINPQSIFEGATEKNKKGNSSYSTQEQLQAAQDYKMNLIGMKPPTLDKKQAETSDGKKYAAMQNIYDSRLGAVYSTLNSIISLRTVSSVLSGAKNDGGSMAMLGDANKVWSAQETKWKTLFPGAPFPPAPSEKDMLDFDVFSRYADVAPQGWQNTIGSKDKKDILVELARMDALQLRLKMLAIEQQEKSNLSLAAILAQMLSPVKQEEMNKLSNSTASAQSIK